MKRHFQGDMEIKSDGRMNGKAVKAFYPTGIAFTNRIPGKGCVNIPIGQNDISGSKERPYLSFITIGEIRAMNQAEGGRSEKLTFLRLPGGGLDGDGGVPFGKIYLVSLEFQPSLKEMNLGGFPRTVQTFHGNESTRIFFTIFRK
jgi:hypothetical protein